MWIYLKKKKERNWAVKKPANCVSEELGPGCNLVMRYTRHLQHFAALWSEDRHGWSNYNPTVRRGIIIFFFFFSFFFRRFLTSALNISKNLWQTSRFLILTLSYTNDKPCHPSLPLSGPNIGCVHRMSASSGKNYNQW